MFCELISIILTLAILSGIFYALWMAVLQIPATPFAWIARLVFWLFVAIALISLLQTGGFSTLHLMHLMC